MRRLPFVAALAVILVAAALPASAQGGPRALVAPGDPLPRQLVELEAGNVGRDLAALIGKRPVLGVYWRPRDPLSEQALYNAQAIVEAVAPQAVFFPVAVLAASQSPGDIQERLTALGLKHLPAREDGGGRLARVLGVRAVPSFFLVDAGSVLRLVGGADITQAGPTGLSIAEALALAGKGAPVPTVGVLPSEPVFRLLGQKLPDLAATELDGATFRKLSGYLAAGKRLLIFYWSPQCPHCRDELPKLAAWHQKKGATDDVVLVTVARAEAAVLRSEAAKLVQGVPGTHLLDVDRSVGVQLAVRETPTSYLVAADGEILAIRPGSSIDWEGWLRGVAGARSTQAR